jgi:NAD(P)H-hydrate epimerase
MNLPVEIYSVESVRNIDRVAIDEYGITGYTLMTRAGQAALQAALATFPESRRWQIVCGSGNNGGDGYVVARLAAEHGIAVSVLALASPESLTGDAAKAYMDFAAMGGAAAEFEGALDADADLLVDALLGSGLGRDVEGRFAQAVRAMNAHRAPVMALDIPSGLNGDDGAVMGAAVMADLTVTFVGLKSGLFVDGGPEHCGQLVFADLDIPADCREGQPVGMQRIDEGLLGQVLPRRARTTHKGNFGHVLVIGGDEGMPGAVRLCGEAALRAGAGLVSIATHRAHAAMVATGRPELICHPIDEATELAPLLERATVVAIGPGLGQSDWSRALFDSVLAGDKPLVVDADALNLLAGSELRHADWILTPHPGEAARLLGFTSADVQADRRAALVALQQRFGGAIVLKGSGTLVSTGSGPPRLCSAGNPGMAAAGMGDVLTGVIAALRAQGLPAEIAAAAGVQAHAVAGDRAAAGGERGTLAGDLMTEIRRCVNP